MLIGKTIISSIEYSGKISLVIFTSHCPLRCKYCHNTELLTNGIEISIEKIKDIIRENYEFIDAVVISGGEPLLQYKELKKLFKLIKNYGLKIKLDTSGIYPEKLKELLPYLDYVSLDVKAPFDKYGKITGADVGKQVKQSIQLINNYEDITLECRTTYVPQLLDGRDMFHIAIEVSENSDIYTIQQFKNIFDDKEYELFFCEEPTRDDLLSLVDIVKTVYWDTIKIKTKEFGEEIICRPI